jgi:hypothetical protein
LEKVRRTIFDAASLAVVLSSLSAACCRADGAPTTSTATTRPSRAGWEWPKATLTLFISDLNDGDADSAAERVAFAPGDAGDAERALVDDAAAACKAFAKLNKVVIKKWPAFVDRDRREFMARGCPSWADFRTQP